MSLPYGTVTFLFTDIEGSTRLWEHYPDAMRLALARHDEIAACVVCEFAGALVKSRGEGDSLFAVFPLATDAAAAACALQRSFAREPWPDALPIKVRMALHTGEAGFREGDYYGTPVNRCARLRAAGHGGQILMSGVTHDLCRDTLSAGCTLRPLGDHRLKDLGRPESIFQLCHPDLSADFPALRSLESLPNNLPQQMTSFVGRVNELGEIVTLCEKARLLTLTGSGGCGKTRLALQAAADMLDGFGDGVWLVELAPLSDPNLAPQALAGVLGLKEQAGTTITQTLLNYLKSRHLLIVLDNCEHLLSTCATLADTILRTSPRVLVLATSREGLGISGELTYRVPSLSMPDPKRDTTIESLSQYDAVRLFIERAQFHQPQFAVTSQNAPALASVCHRLDGIPLAIELAAARARSLTVEDINGRLDQRFRLLTGGLRTALPRHQTLRSLIDWSYDLLNEAERALLCRLSVFSGGWTLEAAEQVCPGDPAEEPEILDLLTSLCDKSLVVAETSGTSVRYSLLETVRQYAWDRLLEGGAVEVWRDRHLAQFAALAEEAEPHLTGAEQLSWLDRLEAEHDNLRAALSWCSEGPDRGCGLRLAGAIWRFWLVRGYLREGRQWLAALLAAQGDADAPIRAKALSGAGSLAYGQGDYPAARALHEESLAIRREIGDRHGVAISLNNLGSTACEQGDYPAARALHVESLAIRREIGDRHGITGCLEGLAAACAASGELQRGATLWGAAERLREDLGAPMSPNDQRRYMEQAAAARAALEAAAAFDVAWEQGRAQTLEQAIELALTAVGR